MPRARDNEETCPEIVRSGASEQPDDNDAVLCGLAAEILALDAEIAGLSDTAEGLPWCTKERFRRQRIEPLVDRGWELRRQLALATASTTAGFRAKASVVQRHNNCAPGYADIDDPDAVAWSLANDLLGVPSVWRQSGEDAA